MTRQVSRLAIAFLLTALLAACSLPSFLPPLEFDTLLLPGSSVVTAEDVYLGATGDALEGPTLFAVTGVSEPRGTGPFPNARVLGDFVRIAAEGAMSTPATAPLLLGLPVPAGVDSERLALAVLVPAELVHVDPGAADEPLPDPRDTWVLVDGKFDPEGRRLITTLTGLPVGGYTAVLVASDAFGSPALELREASLSPQQVTLGFEARCVGFATDDREDECTGAHETFMSGQLEDVFLDLDALGFRAPELRLEFDIFSLNPPGTLPLTYVAELRPYVTSGDPGTLCLITPAGSGNHGRYTASLKRAVVCWGEPELTNDGAGYNGPRVDNLRHEYFHAIQYAYPSASGWFKESTAVVAEDSLSTMVRDTGRQVRDVDVQLNAAPQRYMLQDFWVWLGMRYNLGLADLIPFLEAGGDEAGLNAVFARDYPQLGDLGGAYWAWAKNQSFEKVFALGGNGFATLCGLDTDGSGGYFALANAAAPPVLTFHFTAPPVATNVVLPPLSSRVYQLEFVALPDTGYDTTVSVTGGAESKFYDPADSGTNACVNDPDGTTLPITVAAGQDETRFVLIANTSASSNLSVTVGFAGTSIPSIAIDSPLQNARFDENDVIDFLAVASGFTWADPELVTVTWSYERGGVPVTIGSSQSGEMLSRRLCDGNYTVTATAIDAVRSTTASASVGFVVNDLGSSGNPPAACRPTITILEPRTGQTFADGQLISLRAAISDDHPETDEPLYPVIWREGGPNGRILGSGLEASTRLGAGPHQIYVSYGVANVTIGIIVEAGNAPTATITTPSQDPFVIPWDDVPGCDGTYSLSAFASDPEDGILGGDALSWRVRQNGGISTFLGTGSPVELAIRCGNTYEVTLTATDSGGLQDNDSVTIIVELPPQ